MAAIINPRINQDVLKRVIEEELQDLPPLPAVVVRAMKTIDDPSSAAGDLNRLISSDQALSGKILRLVNSSYYGFARRIGTITHAIVILGFNTIRNLVLSLGVFQAFDRKKTVASLDQGEFWTHSLATAVIASMIGKRKRLNAKAMEELFVSGLMHDVGKLFLDQYFPEPYDVSLRVAKAANISIWEAEKQTLGIGHPLIGKRVVEKWSLPPFIAAAVAHHHQPSFAEAENFELVAIVHAANYLAHKLQFGFSGYDLVEPLAPEVEKWLAFTPEVWAQVEEEAAGKYTEILDWVTVTRPAAKAA